MTSEAQKRASAKYDAKNTRMYAIKMNRVTDADILAKLDIDGVAKFYEAVGNVQGYIKELIRKDMRGE